MSAIAKMFTVLKRSMLVGSLLCIPSLSLRSGEPEAPSPVAIMRVSDTLLTKLIDRDVVRDTPVRTYYKGTNISGNARTEGRPEIKLENNGEAATFGVVFNGVTTSRTQGIHPPVTIYSHSTTKFSATKQIVFEPGKGFHPLPAAIDGDTQVVTDCITTHRRGLLGRIIVNKAWQQVNATRHEELAYAKSNAETRIVDAFDEALEDRLAQLNQATDLRYLAEAYFNTELPPIYQCSTQKGYLQFAITTQPGKTCEYSLPKLSDPPQPIQLWLHKSLFNSDLTQSLALPLDLSKGMRRALIKPLPVLATIVSVMENKPTVTKKIENVAVTTTADWLVVQFSGERLVERAARAKEEEALEIPTSTAPQP